MLRIARLRTALSGQWGLRSVMSAAPSNKATIIAPLPGTTNPMDAYRIRPIPLKKRTLPTFDPASAVPMRDALQKIHSQRTKLYAKLLLYNFPYTVAPTDLIVTHRMPDVQVGDRLELDEIREVGSSDYKLCGRPVLPKGAVRMEAVVMEHSHGHKVRARMRKQRKGRRPLKTIKPRITILRVTGIHVDPNFNS